MLIAFGMNDHNAGSVPIPKFRENLRAIVSRIRELHRQGIPYEQMADFFKRLEPAFAKVL